MNAGIPPAGGGSPSPPGRREVHLQGPRPAPLRVNKDSHKIRKPPPVPKYPQPLQSQTLTRPPANEDRKPVIIYAVSPKVIHADASNFMSVVQQLTGNYTSAASSSSYDDPFGGASGSGAPPSPAARFASIERSSPTERNRERERSAVNSEFVGMVDAEIDVSQNPGILSPAPSNLPGISPGMFSSLPDSQTLWGIHEFLMSPPVFGNSFLSSPSAFGNSFLPSPSAFGNSYLPSPPAFGNSFLPSPPAFGNSFMPSPSALLSSNPPGVSPTLSSPVDLFNSSFFDF